MHKKMKTLHNLEYKPLHPPELYAYRFTDTTGKC
jgi:hypothetical protein